MNVFCLGPEQIDEHWSAFGHHLERFEAEGFDFAADIRAGLKSADKQLFGVEDAGSVLGVVVTKIVVTPKGRVCEVHACCGTSADIRAVVELLLPRIEAWAEEIGCARMRVIGRKGWKRILRDYRQPGVVMEKEFGNGRIE